MPSQQSPRPEPEADPIAPTALASASVAASAPGYGVTHAPYASGDSGEHAQLTPLQITYLYWVQRGQTPGQALAKAHATSTQLHDWRQSVSWRNREAALSTAALYLGSRHARTLLDAGSVGAAMRLLTEQDEAPHARDRIHAADRVLTSVGILSQGGAQQGGVGISIAQAVILVGREARETLQRGAQGVLPLDETQGAAPLTAPPSRKSPPLTPPSASADADTGE